MILSTQTAAYARHYGELEGIRRLASFGYDALDLTLFYDNPLEHPLYQDGWQDYAAKLDRMAQQSGVYFNQAHATFPSYKWNDPEYNERTFPLLVRAVEVASALRIPQIVVHSVSLPDSDAERQIDANLEMYRRLQAYLKPGTRIALENLCRADPATGQIVRGVCSTGADLARMHDLLGDEWFTVCLDLGHCGLIGETAADAVRTLGGKRLKALHVHDNDFTRDAHLPPYWGKIDWPGTCRALGEIDYSGDLTLEADLVFLVTREEAVEQVTRHMVRIGRQLIEWIDAARPQS